MRDKWILITGASSGIGKSCAELLAQSGNHLVLVSRNEERLQKISSELPGEHLVIPYDLSDLVNMKSIMDKIEVNNIKLDGMVYAAGKDATCPIKVNSVSVMSEVMDVNCFAFCELARLMYSPKYSNSGASIVAISSMASLLCEKGQAAYSASKAALNAIVMTMSKEFARRKMRVNAILPMGVMTNMAQEKGKQLEGVSEGVQKVENVQPFGLISPENIAENVKFLLSERSCYTTGELYKISAGYPG